MHLLNQAHKKYFVKYHSVSGFTLPEILVVFLIVGVLATIALPSWLTFVNIQHLNTAQYEVHSAMQQAQSQAKKEKFTWQASFREQNGVLQWAVHPANVDPAVADWKNLDSSIRLDEETTLQQSSGVRYIRFDYRGNVIPLPRRITVSSKYHAKAKRCVIVSTILGVMRTAKEQNKAESGKYCY